VFDRLLGRLIEECESFGLATTMVIPSGLALDVKGILKIEFASKQLAKAQKPNSITRARPVI